MRGEWGAAGGRRAGDLDGSEVLASVLARKGALLLRAHRRRLGREDLETVSAMRCSSSSAAPASARSRARRTRPTRSSSVSCRASPTASARSVGSLRERMLRGATRVDDDAADEAREAVADARADIVAQVLGRDELRRIEELFAQLSRDQRLLLAHELHGRLEAADFCRRMGWSEDKYRKVGQRARARLRALKEAYDSGARCERLAPDLLALRRGVAAPAQHARATAHLSNCRSCAADGAATGRAAGFAARRTRRLAPGPVLAGAAGIVRQVLDWVARDATARATARRLVRASPGLWTYARTTAAVAVAATAIGGGVGRTPEAAGPSAAAGPASPPVAASEPTPERQIRPPAVRPAAQRSTPSLVMSSRRIAPNWGRRCALRSSGSRARSRACARGRARSSAGTRRQRRRTWRRCAPCRVACRGAPRRADRAATPRPCASYRSRRPGARATSMPARCAS